MIIFKKYFLNLRLNYIYVFKREKKTEYDIRNLNRRFNYFKMFFCLFFILFLNNKIENYLDNFLNKRIKLNQQYIMKTCWIFVVVCSSLLLGESTSQTTFLDDTYLEQKTMSTDDSSI